MRKVYSVEEVARHTTRDDCWAIHNSYVFKVPKAWLAEHPGGDMPISELAGQVHISIRDQP